MRILISEQDIFEVNVSRFQETTSDDEVILFFEDLNEIVVLNASATVVWNYINLSLENNESVITIDQIVNTLKDYYDMDNSECKTIYDDVKHIIDEFIKYRLILTNNCGGI